MSEKTSNEMENLSLQAKNRYPRDLLQRFTVPISGIGAPRGSDPDEDPDSGEEIELNLGLSLGGRFGVDKGNSKLIRSSSIATILPVARNDDVLDTLKNPGSAPGAGRAYSGLVRTSSLPVETEEEWRKRKELQSLRRLAAKRRRSEKQRNVTKGERDDYVAAMGRVGSSPGPCFGSDKWSEFDTIHGQRQGSSGSVSQTSSSSQERKKKLSGSSRTKQPIGIELRDKSRGHGMKEIGSDSVEDMPCVFTQGGGPDGRVIEGILYKYGKGEKVKIMCVCHGSFLSPAEFVKHAGGTDIVHPLKHIVVKAGPSLS